MELKIDGNIINKAIIKSENEEIRYCVIENKTDDNDIKYAILKTHISNKEEILDYFDYKEKDDAYSLITKTCEKAEKEGEEVTREIVTSNEPVLKHYIFSDEKNTITYDGDYATIEEAQAFNDLLTKQFRQKFSFHEESLDS